MPILIWQGDRIKDQLDPVYAAYIVKPDCLYTFDIRVAGKKFGEYWGEGKNWLFQKHLLEATMDSYDATDPYGKSLWWGAGGEQVLVQIVNTQARAIDRIWDILLGVFEGKFPEETITVIQTFEGPQISPERKARGRGRTWWEKIADFFRTLGIEVQEHQAWIYAAIILGGVTTSLYFVSVIAKKIPGKA